MHNNFHLNAINPRWPAMIDEDPDEETCYELIDDDDHPVSTLRGYFYICS